MNEDERRGWADRIVQARAERRLLAPMTDGCGATMDDAYAIQSMVTGRRLAAGQRQVGWKLGYTSAAMRVQMGVTQPNLAPLTDAMLVPNDGEVCRSLVQPRVEPEIAVRIGRTICGPLSAGDAWATVDGVWASLEVVDAVWADYRFRIEDNTADGSSAAGVVLGPALDRSADLAAMTVELRQDGGVVATATGAAAMGGPANALAWLTFELARLGWELAAGSLVITGGLTAAVPLEPGARIEAVFDGATAVAVRRAPETSRDGARRPSASTPSRSGGSGPSSDVIARRTFAPREGTTTTTTRRHDDG